MVTATLKKADGSQSVSFDIWRDGAGQLCVSRDIGKPQAGFREAGTSNIIVSDFMSATDVYTVLGIITTYSDAQSIVEDIVKPFIGSTSLELDVTSVPGISNVQRVGVPSKRAIELDYQVGVRNMVDVQLSLPAVSRTQAADATA